MMTVLTSPPEPNRRLHEDWTLESEVRPFHPYVYRPSMGPLEIIVNGPELDWIRQHFSNIPMVAGAKQLRWGGEIAAFIVNNMPCKSGHYSLDKEQA